MNARALLASVFSRPLETGVMALAQDRAEAERRVEIIQDRLYWQGKTLKAAQERIDRLVRLYAWEIRAHDETKRVLVERQDQAGRVQYLERELKDMESSRENLTDIADGLRNELLMLKAKRRKR